MTMQSSKSLMKGRAYFGFWWDPGALAGALIVLFSPAGTWTAEAVVFAALLASLFAPLIDQLVVRARALRRQRRLYG